MRLNIFSIYKRVGKEIIQLCNSSQKDNKRLNNLIEEFETFASIPEARKAEKDWIETVEKVYKEEKNR